MDGERFREASTVGEGIPAPATSEETEPISAWEQIAAGRYMPKRIRGSCLGRELG
jgi:hypothetical protein